MGTPAVTIIEKTCNRDASISGREDKQSVARRHGLGQFLIQATSGASHALTNRARRYKFLLGLAAIGAFLLALPAAALACISAATCVAGGGTVIGGNYCGFGVYSGQTVCPGSSVGPFTPIHINDPDLQDTNFNPMYDPWGQILSQILGGPSSAQANYGYQLGGPSVSLGLFSSDGAAGSYATGGFVGVRNSGYQVSDSNGTVSGQLPGFHAVAGGGGLNLTADGTKIIGYNGDQRLLFNFSFGYSRTDMRYGTSALTPGIANVASIGTDDYQFTGSVTYSHDYYYLNGNASFDFNHDAVTNNFDSGTGSTGGHGYTVGAIAGDWIPLFGAAAKSSPMPTKAPPVDVSGRYATFLNIAGSATYADDWTGGFTDSAGLIYGTEKFSYTDLGARARLVTVIPSNGLAWMPFVGVSLDRRFGFDYTLDVPAQGGAPEDTLFVSASNTFWGTQLGLNILSHGGLSAGISGFYSASADTNILGANVFLKIPLETPAQYADSGITAAKK